MSAIPRWDTPAPTSTPTPRPTSSPTSPTPAPPTPPPTGRPAVYGEGFFEHINFADHCPETCAEFAEHEKTGFQELFVRACPQLQQLCWDQVKPVLERLWAATPTEEPTPRPTS